MPEPTVAEIKRAVVYMAHVVETYGERYAPILDSLIVDLDAAKRRESPRERARRIFEKAQADGLPIPQQGRKRSVDRNS